MLHLKGPALSLLAIVTKEQKISIGKTRHWWIYYCLSLLTTRQCCAYQTRIFSSTNISRRRVPTSSQYHTETVVKSCWSLHSDRLNHQLLTRVEMARQSKRLLELGSDAKESLKDTDDNDENESDKTGDELPKTKQAKRSKTSKVKSSSMAKKNEDVAETPKKIKHTAKSAKKAATVAKAKDDASLSDSSPTPSSKTKAPKHQVITEKTKLEKLWDAQAHPDSYSFKIATWNVAGLRAVIRNNPHALDELAAKHDLDMLCLQEIKLQESHLDDPKLGIGNVMEGYNAYYSCSTAKKGYSGTAVYVRKNKGVKGSSKQQSSTTPKLTSFFAKKGDSESKSNMNGIDDNKANESAAKILPLNLQTLLVPNRVYYSLDSEKHDGEGRTVFVDFSWATICNVYVPNAGQGLVRLSYRVDDWDKDFMAFMQQKQKERNVPVMWLGDLNVAHTNLEVWNDGAKHLAKQAGITPEERASFQAQLDSGFVDAFRRLHPTAQGHYTYWSQRAGNRAPNKGLRLDYFICHPNLFAEGSSVATVRDSYMDPDWLGSDHCPAIIEIELKYR